MFGTVAVIWLSLVTEKLADASPKRTLVAPVRCVPVITTVVPAGPAFGDRPETAGERITVNEFDVVAVPAAVVTLTWPDVAAAGTIALTWLSLTCVNVADTPLNFTLVALPRCAPPICTVVPGAPLLGVNP